MATTGDARLANGAAGFNLDAGDYEIEVEAPGYKKGTEHATVMVNGTTVIAFVFMARVSSSIPASGEMLAAGVQRELDQSLAALRKNKFDEARKHLDKA